MSVSSRTRLRFVTVQRDVIGTTIDLEQGRELLGLRERLANVPAGAGIRGVWFWMAASHVKRLGEPEAAAYGRAVRRRRRLPFKLYPLGEYLEELAAAAAVVDPIDPGEGLRRIWRDAPSAYLGTPFGRSLVKLIGPSPVRYMNWLATHRDHFCNYGSWRLRERGSCYATMEIEDEYIWIDTAHRGGAEGVLRVFGVEGSVEPELVTPYTGTLHIRWSPLPMRRSL